MNFEFWWGNHALSSEHNIAQLGQNPVKVVAEIAFKAGYLQAIKRHLPERPDPPPKRYGS